MKTQTCEHCGEEKKTVGNFRWIYARGNKKERSPHCNDCLGKEGKIKEERLATKKRLEKRKAFLKRRKIAMTPCYGGRILKRGEGI